MLHFTHLTRRAITTFFVTGLLTLLIAPITHAQNKADSVEPYSFRTQTTSKLSGQWSDPFIYKGEPRTFKSFQILPSIDLTQKYTDNVLAVDDAQNPTSDFVTILSPAIELIKNVKRHKFSLNLNSDIYQHWDKRSENIENYSAVFDGEIEALRKLHFPFQISYVDTHFARFNERRADATNITKSPLNTKILKANAGVIYKPNRLQYNLKAEYEKRRLENAVFTDNSILRRDDRNANNFGFNTEISYQLQNNFIPFFQTGFEKQDFINEGSNPVTRNNNLVYGLTGFKFDYKGILNGALGIGLEKRSYQDPAVDNVTDYSFDTALQWEPSAKTRVNFAAKRATLEDNELVSGLTETYVHIQAQQELRHDIFGRASLGYSLDDFEEIDRQDKRFDGRLELIKIINPRFQVGAEYHYIDRNSDIPSINMDNNILMLRLKTNL